MTQGSQLLKVLVGGLHKSLVSPGSAHWVSWWHVGLGWREALMAPHSSPHLQPMSWGFGAWSQVWPLELKCHCWCRSSPGSGSGPDGQALIPAPPCSSLSHKGPGDSPPSGPVPRADGPPAVLLSAGTAAVPLLADTRLMPRDPVPVHVVERGSGPSLYPVPVLCYP